MTDNSDEAVPMAEAIEDARDLYVRQVSFNGYSVLHLQEDEGNTAYEVDIFDLECTCPDMQMNREDSEVCKHLAMALYEADRAKETESFAINDLSNYVREARDTLAELQRFTTGVEADRTAEAARDAAEAGSEDGGGAFDPIDAFEADMRARDVPLEHLEYHIDDQYGSLQVEADGELDDNEWSAYSAWFKQDGVNFDSDQGRNYVKADDLEEVLG